MSKENLKNKGITLIALIITIMVMLILTGVTLSITLGEYGIVYKAKTASDEKQKAIEKEELLSMVMGAYDAKTGNIDSAALVSKITAKGWAFDESTNLVTNKDGVAVGYVNLNTGKITDTEVEQPAEKANLDGEYYSNGEVFCQIKGDAFIVDGEENKIDSIDEATQTVTVAFKEGIVTLKYEFITENSVVVNKLLLFEEEGMKGIIGRLNDNGLTAGEISGIYLREDSGKRLTFDNSASTYDIETSSDSGATWYYESSSQDLEYFCIDGIYYMQGLQVQVDSELNTIIYDGYTYTQQN